jgi:hypothetical protein
MLIKARSDAGMHDRHYPRQTKGAAMHSIAKAFSNSIPSIPPGFDILETVALFCGAGLLIVLVLAFLGSSVLPTEPQAINVMSWI